MKLVGRFLEEILVFRPREFAGENSESRISFETRSSESVAVKALFVQENQSRSFTNVLRGLYYQIKHHQARLIQVIRGKFFNAVVDLRKSSEFFGQHVCNDMNTEENLFLWVPPGFAYGFFVVEGPVDILLKVTDFRFPENERTIRWNDPANTMASE